MTIKIIHSVANENGKLKDENEKLKAALRNLEEARHALEIENAKLKAHLNGRMSSIKFPKSTTAETLGNSQPKNFDKPTKASSARAGNLEGPGANVPQSNAILFAVQDSAKTKPYTYRNGELQSLTLPGPPLKSTVASRARVVSKYQQGAISESQKAQNITTQPLDWDFQGIGENPWGGEVTKWETREPVPTETRVAEEKWRSINHPNGTKGWLYDWKSLSGSSLSQQQYEDLMRLHALVFKTRYFENGVLANPVGQVYIPQAAAYSIMGRALGFAEEIVFRMLDSPNDNKPRHSWRTHPEGKFESSREIEFGRDKLLKWIYEVDFSCGMNKPSEVISTCFRIVDLRNAYVHFDRTSASARKINRFLVYVHQLALQCYEEEYAWKVRALRDELLNTVEATVEEVAGLERMANLPFAFYGWSGHHENMFFAAIYLGRQFPEVIDRAATTWENQIQNEPSEVLADPWETFFDDGGVPQEQTCTQPKEAQEVFRRTLSRRHSVSSSSSEGSASTKPSTVSSRSRRDRPSMF